MKNKLFIQSLNRIGPSKKQKEKMLHNILSQKEKTKFSWKYVWNFGMVAVCIICALIVTKDDFLEKKDFTPTGLQIKTAISESSDFCYRNICYKEIGVEDNEGDLLFLETMFDEKINQNIDVYQGKSESTIIIKRNGSYFLYQKIEE